MNNELIFLQIRCYHFNEKKLVGGIYPRSFTQQFIDSFDRIEISLVANPLYEIQKSHIDIAISKT